MSTAVAPEAGATTVPAKPINNPSNPGGAAQPVDPPGNPPQAEPPKKNEEAPVIPPTAAPKNEVTYDLTLPEGSAADPALVERTVAIARARGLSNDQAQAALDLAAQELTSAQASGREALTQQVEQWKQATMSDPALGKTNEERIAKIQRGRLVVDKFIAANPDLADEFKSVLNEDGIGNHRALVRLMAWMGDSMTEGSLVMPRAQDGAGKKSDTELFYPAAAKAE